MLGINTKNLNYLGKGISDLKNSNLKNLYLNLSNNKLGEIPENIRIIGDSIAILHKS